MARRLNGQRDVEQEATVSLMQTIVLGAAPRTYAEIEEALHFGADSPSGKKTGRSITRYLAGQRVMDGPTRASIVKRASKLGWYQVSSMFLNEQSAVIERADPQMIRELRQSYKKFTNLRDQAIKALHRLKEMEELPNCAIGYIPALSPDSDDEIAVLENGLPFDVDALAQEIAQLHISFNLPLDSLVRTTPGAPRRSKKPGGAKAVQPGQRKPDTAGH